MDPVGGAATPPGDWSPRHRAGQQAMPGQSRATRRMQRLHTDEPALDRVVAVLVPDRQPRDPSWRELCQDLGVVLLCRNEFKRAPALDMP